MQNLKFIDLFSGMGGFRLAFENHYFNCVFSSEIDKHAKKTYFDNFNEHQKGDITKIKAIDIPDHDLLLAGFPCQPFSIAGNKKGFSDKNSGQLFFDVLRILTVKKPPLFLLENVKNLKTHNKGKTLKAMINQLEKIGYYVNYQIINTADHNIAQNRERIYIVGFLSKTAAAKFTFPKKVLLKTAPVDFLFNTKQADNYYYNNKPLFIKLAPHITKKGAIYQWRRQYVRENKKGQCPTLTANMGTGGHNVPIIKDDFGIRKLIPRECANFQGYPQNFKLNVCSDSQLYKQIGNSVTIPVIKKLKAQLLKAID